MRIMKSAKKAVKKAAAKRKSDAAKKKAHKVAVAPFLHMGGGRIVKIRKLGPIAEADIRLKPLTVFAGPNGTGKTFACKALYSFFRAMDDNHVEAAFRRSLEIIDDHLARVRNYEPRHSDDIRKIGRAISGAEEKVRVLRDALSRLPGGNFQSQIARADQLRPSLAKMCGEIQDAFKQAYPVVKEASTGRRAMIKMPPHPEAGTEMTGEFPAVDLHGTMKSLVEFADMPLDVCQKSGRKLVADGMRANLEGRLTRNFQSNFLPRKFQKLNIRTTDLGALEIGGCGSFTQNGDGRFELPPDDGLWQPEFHRVIFLDSPVYWKLRNPLEDRRLSGSPSGPRPLDDIPQYFDDLASLLRKKFSPPEIRSVCARLEKIIGGKIVLTEWGELLFREKTGMRTMHNTAGGKVNLGMLSFLIERGVIAENSLVFIDEPESNLHPAWQGEMAETLARLVNGGVHVVIATQSDWMLSTIANIVRRGELRENGEKAALEKERVGVWLFERGKKGGGSAARELRFDSAAGYIPDDLRDLSNAMHNDAAELLDEMDEREHASALAGEGAE